MKEFFVSGEVDLNALLRALIEAKLPESPRDTDIAASPIVARLATEVADANAEFSRNPNDLWRTLDANHGYWWPTITRALHDAHFLLDASCEQRDRYVRALIAPFEVTEKVLADLVSEIDRILKERGWYSLYIRPENPFGDGMLVVRDRADGAVAIYSRDEVEILASSDRFEISEWLFERGFTRVGCFVQRPEFRHPPDYPK